MENTALYFGIAGIVSIGAYLVRYTKNKDYQKNGIKTDGVVTDVILDGNNIRSRCYYPVVSFMLQDGTWIKAQYSDGTNPASFKVDEKVGLLYKLDNPNAYMITDSKSKHIDKIFLVIGVLTLSYSLYHLIT